MCDFHPCGDPTCGYVQAGIRAAEQRQHVVQRQASLLEVTIRSPRVIVYDLHATTRDMQTMEPDDLADAVDVIVSMMQAREGVTDFSTFSIPDYRTGGMIVRVAGAGR